MAFNFTTLFYLASTLCVVAIRSKYNHLYVLPRRAWERALKQSIALLCSSMHSHAEHGNENKKEVGWAKPAQPNSKVSDNSIVGLHYVQHQPTVGANILKQSNLKSSWYECHKANLPKVLKTLQSIAVPYFVITQQGYVHNKLRKRKVSQIYISNNLNYKESI